MNYLYVYVKKGTPFKVGDELCEKRRLAIRADYITLPNGDSIGKVVTANGMTRTVLEGVPGITVLPPAHRPLQQTHIDAFKGCGLKTALAQGDTAYEFGEKLHATHGIEWMHPENWFLGRVAGSVDATDIRRPDGQKESPGASPQGLSSNASADQNPSTPAPATSTPPT